MPNHLFPKSEITSRVYYKLQSSPSLLSPPSPPGLKAFFLGRVLVFSHRPADARSAVAFSLYGGFSFQSSLRPGKRDGGASVTAGLVEDPELVEWDPAGP